MAAGKTKTQGRTARKGSSQASVVRELMTRITDSLLPGEAPLPDARLKEMAGFLLDAGRTRAVGTSAIKVETAQGERRFMRIAIINKDMPFLVDSIASVLAAHNLPIDLLVHPIVPIRRDEDGNFSSIPEGDGSGEKRESLIYLETARVDARERRALEKELSVTIEDVRAAVRDWPRMREVMETDAERMSDAEGAALLRWMSGGMLTMLGHVTRRRDGTHSQMLGVCRKGTRDIAADETFEGAFRWFDGHDGKPGRAPLIIKANRIARVHRRVPLDLFIVPVVENGRVEALSVHAGTWTSAALTTPPENVPVLRQQLAAITERFDFDADSHDHKSLIHALTALPHDLIISFSDDDIARVATAMMGLAQRPRPRAELVAAPLARHVFAFVWLPRDMLSTAVRLQIQELLEKETGADTLDWSLAVEGGTLALLRYVLDFRGKDHGFDSAAVDARLQALLRGWTDAVEEALGDDHDANRAAALAARYSTAFAPYYRTRYGAQEAARDIDRLRRLGIEEDDDPRHRDARLYRLDSDPADQMRLKVYQHEGSLPLSDAVPALENFGFRVLEEIPSKLEGDLAGTIHDFTLGMPLGAQPDALLARAAQIETAITSVLNQVAEDDVFNRLVVLGGLEAQETDWLRAFYRYLRQANIAFTIYTVVDALAGAPKVTRGLIDLFRTQHDPAFRGDRAKAADKANDAIRTGLVDVVAINDDRLLRLYWSTMQAILRTNAFAPAAARALAFKFDSSLVPGLPKPVPWREIFVYSRRVEGIHLRAGPVARGGLRWSDRRDDFRTEILGLMKAQRVKNAVIVPTGAKGGFYPKNLPNPQADRDAWFTEGKESYKVFIRTLLSITDNIVEDQVVHPEGVVIHDGEDPYFVVAADKGTATFSDTANAIAVENEFWLDDAFASGGSNGYDHKAMGITARGAWISVQRHFLEMGVDVQKDETRVVGCGDMSGDVFGNGMLLSKAIKLVAAFDHRHIFIDPDPDPAKSWKERKRLFDLSRSSWDDYDTKLISKGGGVFPRTTKSISLSKQARVALGVEDDALDPDALISAILRAPVDLLWFGGIGTYVKSAGESHADVGDPANDALRVNARDVGAKVIGEGANLGITQAGRIAFAIAGGRINTDFIDNSAGVDCSDNEVNIKIALAAARRNGRLSESRRNALLEDMTDEVAALVLEDNRLQALALSIAEQGGAKALGAHERLIETLEDIGDLDRQTEGLDESEDLRRRGVDGKGLTRPELAVLLSSSKLAIQDSLESCTLADDDAAIPLLLGDFPEKMQDKFAGQIKEHRLRREIVATVVANKLVNRLGIVHPFELAEEEGAGLDRIGGAFVAASRMLEMDAVWQELDTAAMPETARLMLFDQAALALRGHMADLLRAGGDSLKPASLCQKLDKTVGQLRTDVDTLLGEEARDQMQAIAARLADGGAPAPIAATVARLFALDGSIGLASLAADTGIGVARLAHAFTDLGAKLGLDWAQSKAAVMSPEDPWERVLVAGLARDFQQMRLDFLRGQAKGRDRAEHDPLDQVQQWVTENHEPIAQFRMVVGRAQTATPVRPAMLAQIASQARNLLLR